MALGTLGVLAQVATVNFSNGVFGTTRLVYDLAGQPLVGTNYLAQLYLDTPTGLISINGDGTGRFKGFIRPGTWAGGARNLPGIAYGQPVQLEVRIWDRELYGSYEAAATAGGITGTSGLFSYTYAPGFPPSPSDDWLKNLTSIRLVDQPEPPPLIDSIHVSNRQEGAALTVEPNLTGGTPPLSYLWQLPDGAQVTTRTLELGGAGLRPGLIDFNLTVTDAGGRVTPATPFRIEVANRAPEVRTAVATGALEGERVAVTATADYAWPPSAVRARWTLPDGRTADGLQTLLPLLSPGHYNVQLQVSELGLVSLYDNLDSIGGSPTYHAATEETGDELIFARTNQVIHEISIYYFADLSALTPVERAQASGRLRLYRNDGPAYPGSKSLTPGTLLYESPAFGLNSGFFLQRFTEVNVPAPDRLTWTVVWSNLPQITGKLAGLVVGDVKANPAPGNAGFSYNDFWVKHGGQWGLFHLGNFKPVANFASRATAVGSEVAAISLSVPVPVEVTNVPPVLTTVATPAGLVVGQAGEFRAAATDVGPEPLRYHWTWGDGATADGAEATHAYAAVGRFTGRVVVSDPYGGEAARDFTVDSTAERRPLGFVGTPPVGAVQDQDYFATIAVNPPGVGQTIRLTPVTLPAWLHWTEVSATEGRLQGRPGNADVGLHAVVIAATDGLATERLEFTVAVRNVNDAPSLTAPLSVNVAARTGVSGLVVTLADPDAGDALSLTVASGDPALLPPDLLVLGGSGRARTLAILPTSGAGGTIPVTLTVSDGQLSAQATLTVILAPAVEYPVTVATTPGGTVTLSPAADRYAEGFQVLATAVPKAGWELRRWLGLPGGPVLADDLDLLWPVTAPTVFSGEFADIAAPLVRWESPAPGLTANQVVTLVGQVSDNDRVATVRLRRPGVPVQELTLTDGRYQVAGVRLDSGENTFTVEAVDASGNATTNQTVLVWEAGSVLVVGDAPDTREGHTVTFPVQLQSQQPLSGLTFNLHYDDYVPFLGDARFEASGLLPGALLTFNTNTPGVVQVTLAAAGEAIPAGRHDLGTLKFRVRSLLSKIGLQAFVDPELLEVSNELGDPVPGVDGISGSTRLLPRRVTADLNGNDRLDIGDAGLLQRLVVGLDPKRSWDTALSDLNLNGNLDSGDVVRVMRVVIGLDPQPVRRTMGAPWPPVRSGGPRLAGLDPGWLELTPGTISTPRGEIFEAQVRVKQPVADFRGLSFELVYPAQFLGLISPNGYAVGPVFPAGATPYWSSQPELGRLRFAVMSETNRTLGEGVLATFRFRVGMTVPANWQGEFGLRRVESTVDGYGLDASEVAPGSVALAGEVLVPIVKRVQVNEGGALQFDVLANPGAVLVLEGTADLGLGAAGWRPLVTQVHDQLPLFVPPPAAGSGSPPVQFFRVRTEAPALLAEPTGGGR